MTNKKIDIWFRFMLYFAPFIVNIIILYGAYRSGVVSISNPTGLIGNFFTGLATFMQWTNTFIFTDFTDWLTINLGINQYALWFIYYCYFLVYVEFALLIKNVLLYLFKVANYWLERGVNNGK